MKILFGWRGYKRKLGKPTLDICGGSTSEDITKTMPKQNWNTMTVLTDSKKHMLLFHRNTTSLHIAGTQKINITIKHDQLVDSVYGEYIFEWNLLSYSMITLLI
jgi:hypothetical protein